MEKSQTNASKRRRGRPKGSKSGLPFTTFPKALEYSKKVWNKAQYNEMAFKDISAYMGLHAQKAVRVLNSLQKFYGVVEKTGSGYWRLTDAGKRVVKNDPIALKEVFSKNQMFADLYNTFGNRDVTEGVILDHIKKKYRGTDAEETRRRFLECKTIINNAERSPPEPAHREVSQDLTLPLFQLRYALKPPSDRKIKNLVEKVVRILSDSNDDVLKLISDLMTEKMSDKEELANLLDKAMNKLNLDASEGVEEEKTQSD